MVANSKIQKGISNTVLVAGVLIIIIVIAGALYFSKGGETTTTETTQAESYSIILSTGSPGGIYNPLGFKIAQVVDEYNDKLQVTAQESGASVANALAIANGDAQIALMQSDVAYFAYNGELISDFEGNPVKDLRGLAALYPEPIQIVARADSGIKTIWDLEGKVVAVGNPGSGLYATSYTILNALGLWDKIIVQELGYTDAAAGIKQGTVDAFFNVAGVPTPKITELESFVDLVLVEVPDDAIQVLKEKGLTDIYVPYIIPAGSYDFQTTDVKTLTVKALLVCDKDLPDDVVYSFLQTMFDHLEEIQQVHQRAKDISQAKATEGMPIPLHSGAEAYYKDIGIIE